MIPFRRVHDISVILGKESVSWPGDPPYERKVISSVDEGRVSTVSVISMSVHLGTHLDTPAHFLAGAGGLDAYEPADFILPAVVVDAGDAPAVTAQMVHDARPTAGGAILFRTANSAAGRIASGEFFQDGVHLLPEAAAACVDHAVRLVGIDYFTIDAFGCHGFPVHHILLSERILVLETINLRHVRPGAYTLICLPLRLAGAEASPVRAVLLE
jgi:arylformamidase